MTKQERRVQVLRYVGHCIFEGLQPHFEDDDLLLICEDINNNIIKCKDCRYSYCQSTLAERCCTLDNNIVDDFDFCTKGEKG